MTPERTKELLPIITAFANGEEIQYKSPRTPWTDIKEAYWVEVGEYRIKPKVPEYRLFKWDTGPVGVYTRNHFGCSSADLIYFVATSKHGKWITDWLPIPNYNE